MAIPETQIIIADMLDILADEYGADGHKVYALFEAAPDLLEACELVVGKGLAHLTVNDFGILVAAIKKARGE
jgi:hypothetical protein